MKELYNLDFICEITNGKKDVMNKLLENFLLDAPVAIVNLQKFENDKKYQQMKLEAHSIKPLFSSIGSNEAIKAIEKIESYCSSPIFYELIRIEMDNLMYITNQICSHLRKMLSEQY